MKDVIQVQAPARRATRAQPKLRAAVQRTRLRLSMLTRKQAVPSRTGPTERRNPDPGTRAGLREEHPLARFCN